MKPVELSKPEMTFETSSFVGLSNTVRHKVLAKKLAKSPFLIWDGSQRSITCRIHGSLGLVYIHAGSLTIGKVQQLRYPVGLLHAVTQIMRTVPVTMLQSTSMFFHPKWLDVALD